MFRNLLLIVGLCVCSPTVSAKQNRCLGLVLKGGANRGSYEAGAIHTLINNLPPEEVMYDVVSGISVGALNAAHCATYAIGQEGQMADDLVAMWSNLTSDNIYQNWRGGILAGLLWQKGLYDNTPLRDFITEY